MTAPKCTSWRGHRFEARYSKEPAAIDVVSLAVTAAKTSFGAREVIEASQGEAYIHDICIRCGHVVQAPDMGRASA